MLNNPVMQLMQQIRTAQNPIQFIMQRFGANNPELMRVMQDIQGKNPQQIEQYARNRAKAKNFDLQGFFNQTGLQIK